VKRAAAAWAVLLALVLPATTSADIVTSRDRDGVAPDVAERFALTPAERRALDIDSVQVMGHEGLGLVVDVRFKADVPKARPAPGALRRVEVALDPAPDRSERRTALVRVGSTVKLLLLGSGFADLRQVAVASFLGPRRATPPGGTAVPADVHEVMLDPADTTPGRLECGEIDPMYDDLTEAIGAFTTRRFRMEKPGATPRPEAYRRVRAGLGLAFTLGGDAEVAYPRAC
jgi:hypothetical protein